MVHLRVISNCRRKLRLPDTIFTIFSLHVRWLADSIRPGEYSGMSWDNKLPYWIEKKWWRSTFEHWRGIMLSNSYGIQPSFQDMQQSRLVAYLCKVCHNLTLVFLEMHYMSSTNKSKCQIVLIKEFSWFQKCMRRWFYDQWRKLSPLSMGKVHILSMLEWDFHSIIFKYSNADDWGTRADDLDGCVKHGTPCSDIE